MLHCVPLKTQNFSRCSPKSFIPKIPKCVAYRGVATRKASIDAGRPAQLAGPLSADFFRGDGQEGSSTEQGGQLRPSALQTEPTRESVGRKKLFYPVKRNIFKGLFVILAQGIQVVLSCHRGSWQVTRGRNGRREIEEWPRRH